MYCIYTISSIVTLLGIVVTLIVTTTTQKHEHSTALQPIMFGFFYAYSMHKGCIIGNGYGNGMEYRQRLLKIAIRLHKTFSLANK